MSHKISSKICHFLQTFWNLPHVNEVFSYIYIYFINVPEMKGKSPWCPFEIITCTCMHLHIPKHWHWHPLSLRPRVPGIRTSVKKVLLRINDFDHRCSVGEVSDLISLKSRGMIEVVLSCIRKQDNKQGYDRAMTFSLCLQCGAYSRAMMDENWKEPHREKTCFCFMQTTKAQISLRIRADWSAPLLFAP